MRRFTDMIARRLLEELPIIWEGEESIVEMKEQGYPHWRQMEWPGFYFEYMCREILGRDGFFEIPGRSYGNVSFDGFKTFNFDFKAHSENASSSSFVPTNGRSAIESAIIDDGGVGFIIASGYVTYDEDGSFRQWHEELKGRSSQYSLNRAARGAKPRRRKTVFELREIIFYYIDHETIQYVDSFQEGMRNSNGRPRNAKVKIDLNDSRFEMFIYRIGR